MKNNALRILKNVENFNENKDEQKENSTFGRSSPPLRTDKKAAKNIGKRVFLYPSNLVADKVANNGKNSNFDTVLTTTTKQRISRKPVISVAGYPYRPARVAKDGNDYVIIFYVWDITTQDLVRKRLYRSELSSITDENERQKFAEEKIRIINAELKKGAYIESEIKQEFYAESLARLDILQAIDYVRNIKDKIEGLKKSTLRDYKKLKSNLTDYLNFKNISAPKLSKVNAIWIRNFFDYIKSERQVTNKTYNGRLITFHAVFECLMNRDKRLYKSNPCDTLKNLRTRSNKHAPYTIDQIKKVIADTERDGKSMLTFFVYAMFYSLARPNELTNLKVGDFKMKEKLLRFASEDAKNNREDYVGISDRFAEIIKQSGILNYPDHYYVFGLDGGIGRQRQPDKLKENSKLIPSEKPIWNNYFTKHMAPYLSEFKKLNKNYTMYGFKHSGAIHLYLETKDVKLVQRQLRHKTLDMTLIYLRELDMFVDFSGVNNWKAI